MDNLDSLAFCAPCGVCRQVLREFVNPETFKIVLAEIKDSTIVKAVDESKVNIKTMTLAELLPLGFGPENLAF